MILVIQERTADMRLFGFIALGVCGLAILSAIGLGLYGAEQGWERATIIKSTAGLALLAEVCFWIGGGILGLSIIRRRREAIARFFGRILPGRGQTTPSSESGE
ncbi:MAG: hypothetical protein AAF830_04410 [Pseudomonadota bacterium]